MEFITGPQGLKTGYSPSMALEWNDPGCRGGGSWSRGWGLGRAQDSCQLLCVLSQQAHRPLMILPNGVKQLWFNKQNWPLAAGKANSLQGPSTNTRSGERPQCARRDLQGPGPLLLELHVEKRRAEGLQFTRIWVKEVGNGRGIQNYQGGLWEWRHWEGCSGPQSSRVHLSHPSASGEPKTGQGTKSGQGEVSGKHLP